MEGLGMEPRFADELFGRPEQKRAIGQCTKNSRVGRSRDKLLIVIVDRRRLFGPSEGNVRAARGCAAAFSARTFFR